MLDEYKRLHRAVPPELVAEQQAAGIRDVEVFEDDPLLVVVSTVTRLDAWERFRESEASKKWARLMSPLLEDEGGATSRDMASIYRMSQAPGDESGS